MAVPAPLHTRASTRTVWPGDDDVVARPEFHAHPGQGEDRPLQQQGAPVEFAAHFPRGVRRGHVAQGVQPPQRFGQRWQRRLGTGRDQRLRSLADRIPVRTDLRLAALSEFDGQRGQRGVDPRQQGRVRLGPDARCHERQAGGAGSGGQGRPEVLRPVLATARHRDLMVREASRGSRVPVSIPIAVAPGSKSGRRYSFSGAHGSTPAASCSGKRAGSPAASKASCASIPATW